MPSALEGEAALSVMLSTLLELPELALEEPLLDPSPSTLLPEPDRSKLGCEPTAFFLA
jgi:hypothetical protein